MQPQIREIVSIKDGIDAIAIQLMDSLKIFHFGDLEFNKKAIIYNF
jgi:hypothetical protein